MIDGRDGISVSNLDTGEKPIWQCCRIRAGPLVKEVRMIRPRYSSADTSADHRDKAELKRHQRTAVTRSSVDRLENLLGVIGYGGTQYVLTFDDAHLPWDFPGVRRALRAYVARAVRWKDGPLDYIYCIEGLHGDGRYHIHFVCDYNVLAPEEVRHLWRDGMVLREEPVLKAKIRRDPSTGIYRKEYDGGFRRLAEYLHKERTDGIIIPIGRHPWGWSRSLLATAPAPERWMDPSGAIEIPQLVPWHRSKSVTNQFGAYSYGAWIEPQP